MRNDKERRHAEDCGQFDCGDGLRNRFFRGKAMGVDEFRIEQRYLIERRRLLNRAIVGQGVAHGFAVTREIARRAPLKIGKGFALDCHGAEIVNAATVELMPANAVMLRQESDDCLRIARDKAFEAGPWLLSVHYAERDRERVLQDAGCECKTEEFKFLCETLVFSLRSLANCPCPCGEPRCEPCGCGAGTCGDGGRIARRCQCGAAEAVPGCGPWPERRNVCEWQGLYFDPDAGVPLACITIDVDPTDRCAPASFDEITDDCGPRRHIKTNERLYDLIRGCDLTHIESVSWKDWHRDPAAISWKRFRDQFKPDPNDPTPAEERECRTEFVVTFSKPVLTKTLTPDAFVFRGITREQGTSWGDSRRVPVVKIDTQPTDGAWSKGTTNQARIIVRWSWFNDEVSDNATDSWFKTERGVPMEIEIRGDLILDCNGIAVDASPRGMQAQCVPSGNGTPGGSFVSAFTVAKKSLNTGTEP